MAEIYLATSLLTVSSLRYVLFYIPMPVITSTRNIIVHNTCTATIFIRLVYP